MDQSVRGAIWIIATGVVLVGAYFFREPLTQFALALMLWLAIDELARFFSARVKFLPHWLAIALSVIIVIAFVSLVTLVVTRNLGAFAGDASLYESRLNAIAANLHASLGMRGPPPTVDAMLSQSDPADFVRQIGSAIQSVASDTIFIFIYLGFIISAAETFPKRLDRIFRAPSVRERAARVFTSIRLSMSRYLWTQTIVSLIICALTYPTLLLIGLENALFWTFIIFFLNYIPTIGSIIAVALPTAFALVQFPDLSRVALTAAGVGVWQFVIGNFIQPRMTGDSLNLSAVVVLLSLSIWGIIWGIAGAFLAAPITVMVMIVLAQFKSTRWMAILLSADGRPTLRSAADEEK
ncbi:MAG: AI-2E family transporter [Hyphomonadaceae bacterium]